MIREQELKREIQDLKREIQELKRDIEQLERIKTETANKIKDLGAYKDRIKKEYKGEVIQQSKIIKKNELSQDNLQELEDKKGLLVEQLNKEILVKTRELNTFKNSKKDFVNKLKNQEKKLRQNIKELEQKTTEVSKLQEGIEKREKLLKNEIIRVKKEEEVVKGLEARLDLTRGQIQRNLRGVEDRLGEIEEIKAKKEQELQKQLNITKTLENKSNILDLKIEAQNKRELPIRRLEVELKEKEIKLLDDRNSLNRAWAELKGGK